MIQSCSIEIYNYKAFTGGGGRGKKWAKLVMVCIFTYFLSLSVCLKKARIFNMQLNVKTSPLQVNAVFIQILIFPIPTHNCMPLSLQIT